MIILNKCIIDFHLPLYLHYILNIFLSPKIKNEIDFPCFLYMDLSQNKRDAAGALKQRLNTTKKISVAVLYQNLKIK